MSFVRTIVASLLLVIGMRSRVAGQAAPGAVEGVAKTVEDSTPIAFALVRLVPLSSGDTRPQGITSAQGRFRFSAVPAGDYRLELLRIGYRPVLSPVLHVTAGETLQHDIRGTVKPIPLPTVMVYAEGACLNSAELAKDPYLSALWEDIRKGVEIRQAFELRYRFKSSMFQASAVKVPSKAEVRQERADTVNNEPSSALALRRAKTSRRQEQGYGRGNRLTLPDENELLDETFLREHCIIPTVAETDVAIGVRFRQANKQRKGFGIQGTIWVDASTRLMRALELQHLDGDKPISEVMVKYEDLAVAGSALRLPSAGVFTLRPTTNAPRGTIINGTLSFSFWSFEEVRPE